LGSGGEGGEGKGKGMQEQQIGKREKAEKNEATVSDAVGTSTLNSRGADRGRVE